MTKTLTGYRQLTDEEIDVINSLTDIGTILQEMLDDLKEWKTVDQRWLAIARTDFQVAFMEVNRAISSPSKF